jgi:hypothetical protein
MTGAITHEESQEVTKAFRMYGHDFYSNDLQPCSGGFPEFHVQGDCFHFLTQRWLSLRFLGAHPDCTYLTNAGVRWLASVNARAGYVWSEAYKIYINPERFEKMKLAAIHFRSVLSWVETIGMGYVENPIMHKYAMEIIGRQPTQIIQPWQFGHGEQKATCLWLVNLPKLEPTNIVEGREQRIWKLPPTPDRAKLRSKTFPGIAKAMPQQWGHLIQQALKAA